MTDIDVYRPAAEITAPADRDIDSWIGVVKEVVNLAKLIYDTEFVPKGLRGSMPATAAAILSGREMGLGPMTSLQHIHVIGGKPGQSALLMRALIEAQGHKWEDVDISDTRVILRGRRKDQSAWTEVTFTADQARKAGIQLGGYPQDKLYARASVRLARRRFADVIVGMPYAIEELEDGDALEGTVAEDGPAAIKPAQNGKSRTAQRKQRTPDASPAPPLAPPSAATTPAPSPAESAGEALPPLPGETEDPAPAAQDDAVAPAPRVPAAGAAPDDRDYDTPGTATRGKGGQLTAIWTILNTVFGFTDEEKPQARAVCEHITRRKLPGNTTANLSKKEASQVLDTLAHWQAQAEHEGTPPRDYLIAVMAAQEEARDD